MSYRYYPTQDDKICSIYTDFRYKFVDCFFKRDGAKFCCKVEFFKEIIPLMYVISDIAVITAKEDREFVSTVFKVWYQYSIDERTSINQEVFTERVNFYAEFVRGKEPRYDWLFNEKPDWADNGILRCCAAFGDIIFNHNCVDNYDKAPIQIRDFFQAQEFVLIMQEFIAVVADFYDELYEKYTSLPDNYKSDISPTTAKVLKEEKEKEAMISKFLKEQFFAYQEREKKKKENIKAAIFLGVIFSLFIILAIFVSVNQ